MVYNEMPEEGELVVATVRQVKNFGVVVELDEYPDLEGFLHIAEVASGWVKYIRDHVREGQKIVCKVLGVDDRKRYKSVDLSLKAVNAHQKREKIQQWKGEQKARKLVGMLCEQMGMEFSKGMEEFGYQLIQEYGSLYAAMEACAIKESALEEAGFTGDWMAEFLAISKDNITPPYVEINGILELTSPAPGGMQDIKSSLEIAERIGNETEEVKLKIYYLGAPKYRLILEAPAYKIAEEILKEAAQAAVDHLIDHEGDGRFIRKA